MNYVTYLLKIHLEGIEHVTVIKKIHVPQVYTLQYVPPTTSQYFFAFGLTPFL